MIFLTNISSIKIKVTIFIILLLSLYQVSFSQSFAVKNYSEDNGLPSPQVYDIVQDTSGCIWFTYRLGITRYDGRNWKIYSYPINLNNPNNTKLEIDQVGTLWTMANKSGIILEYFDGSEWNDYEHKLNNHNVIPSVFKVLNNLKDTIVAVGTNEFGLFVNNKNKWISFSTDNGFISNVINDIEVNDNKFFIATSEGISIYNDGVIDNSLVKVIPQKYRDVLALKIKDNAIWMMTWNSVGYIKDNKYHLVIDNLKFNMSVKDFWTSILPVSETKLFVASSQRIYLINPSTKQTFILGESCGLINNRGAISLFEDKEQNIWISGAYGISKIPKIKFLNYNTEHGLMRDEVTTIEEIYPGKYIFGHEYGYSIFENGTVTSYSLEKSDKKNIGYSKLLDCSSDKNGNVWFAGEKLGFGKLQKNNQILWYKGEHENANSANSIIQKSDGSIWGLTENSLYKLEGKIFKRVPFRKKNIPGFFRKMFLGPDERIYIASNNYGILYQDGEDGWEIIDCDGKFGKNNIYSIFFEKEKILVGTSIGLHYVDGDSIEYFNQEGFSINRPVYFITKDFDNNLWFGTDKGVTKWDGQNSSFYGTIQGLSGLETNRDAGYIDTKGRLWFGTNGGVSEYVEDTKGIKTTKPVVKIASIFADTVDVTSKQDIEISFDLNSILFNIQILSYIDESKNTFKYYLEGLEHEWQSEVSGINPRIRYFHLQPGSYKLFVQAKNANGLWSDIITSKAITVQSPFYQSVWFYIIAGLLALFLIYAVIQYFLRKRYTFKLEREIIERTEKLNIAEKQYTQMFEENRAIMLIIDPVTGKIKNVNPAALVYYGYSKSVLLEKNFKDIDYLFDEEFEVYTSNDSTTNYYLTQHQISNKTLRDVEVYFTVVNSNGGNLLYAIIHDVSDRVKFEKDLHESEEKYRNLVGSLQDGVFVIRDDKLIFINDALANLVGYTTEEMLGQTFAKFIFKEDSELVLDKHHRRMAGEDIEHQYEIRMIHKAGRVINVLLNANLVEFEGQQSVIGTAKNITQIKRNEETLRKLSMAVEQSPVSTIITNLKGEIEYVNPTFTSMTGYELPDVFRKNPNILKTDNTTKEEYKVLWQTITRGNIWRGEILNRRKNNELYWVSAVISPVKNSQGKITHYLAVEEDITFDKYAKDELKRNEELFNSVLSNISVVLFALNRDARITFARGKVLEEFNLTEDLILGRKAHVLFKGMDDIFDDIDKAVNQKSFKSIRLVNGKRFEVTFSPLYNDKQKFIGSIGIAYDITESEKVKAELIKAKDIAETSDRLKSEFLAQMSHEIRTPINSILSFTSLLKTETQDILPKELTHCFQIIDSGGRRLIRTVDLILNMAQIQTDSYNPIFTNLDLEHEILRDVYAELKASAQAKQLEFNMQINTDKTIINIDHYTVEQIFLNLIENAIKYTENGSINVLLTLNENDELVVSVQDTGIGISQEFIPHLFTPFSQEESGYTRKFEGTGLGLALVDNYVKLNNAEITVESTKGVGSRFIVTFLNQKAQVNHYAANQNFKNLPN